MTRETVRSWLWASLCVACVILAGCSRASYRATYADGTVVEASGWSGGRALELQAKVPGAEIATRGDVSAELAPLVREFVKAAVLGGAEAGKMMTTGGMAP